MAFIMSSLTIKFNMKCMSHNCFPDEHVCFSLMKCEYSFYKIYQAHHLSCHFLYEYGILLFFSLAFQYVYWSDVKERSIHRAKLYGGAHEVFLNASSGLGFVDGMSILISKSIPLS